jgi:hypothetical protein
MNEGAVLAFVWRNGWSWHDEYAFSHKRGVLVQGIDNSV